MLSSYHLLIRLLSLVQSNNPPLLFYCTEIRKNYHAIPVETTPFCTILHLIVISGTREISIGCATGHAPTFDFYTSKIRPTSHTHATSGVVVYSLARLWKGKMINIGELISETIMSRENDRRSPPLGLCYPNLIRRLCERAGVDIT